MQLGTNTLISAHIALPRPPDIAKARLHLWNLHERLQTLRYPIKSNRNLSTTRKWLPTFVPLRETHRNHNSCSAVLDVVRRSHCPFANGVGGAKIFSRRSLFLSESGRRRLNHNVLWVEDRVGVVAKRVSKRYCIRLG